jgi:hypothetical protein
VFRPETNFEVYCKKATIIDSDIRDFIPVIKESDTEIVVILHHPFSAGSGDSLGELLGFNRFDKRVGSLELNNFKA